MRRNNLSRMVSSCLVLASCLALLAGGGCCSYPPYGHAGMHAGMHGSSMVGDCGQCGGPCDGGCGVGPAHAGHCGHGGLSGLLWPVLHPRLACGAGCGETYWNEWHSDPPVCDPCSPCGQDYVGHPHGGSGWRGPVGRGPLPIIGGALRGARHLVGRVLHSVLYGVRSPYHPHDYHHGMHQGYGYAQCDCGDSGCDGSCYGGASDGAYTDGGYVEGGYAEEGYSEGSYEESYPATEGQLSPTPADAPVEQTPPATSRRPKTTRPNNPTRSVMNRPAAPRIRRN